MARSLIIERDHNKDFALADQMSGRNKVARRKGKGGGGDEVSIDQPSNIIRGLYCGFNCSVSLIRRRSR